MERIGTLPNTDWLTTVTDLFAKNGPYLVAVLLLVIAISLIRSTNFVGKVLCFGSFAFAILAAAYAILVWSEVSPWGPNNENIRYVKSYSVLDDVNFFSKLLNRIEASSDLEKVSVYSAPEWSTNKVYIILVSELPLADDKPISLFLYPRGSPVPIVFCHPAANFQQIDIARDETRKNVPDSSKFTFRVMTDNEWKPLSCGTKS